MNDSLLPMGRAVHCLEFDAEHRIGLYISAEVNVHELPEHLGSGGVAHTAHTLAVHVAHGFCGQPGLRCDLNHSLLAFLGGCAHANGPQSSSSEGPFMNVQV